MGTVIYFCNTHILLYNFCASNLLLPAQRSQHICFSAFGAFNVIFPVKTVSGEKTFEKARLKMLPAIRTFKMMAGRFDRDSDNGNDNDDSHQGDNNHVWMHNFLLIIFIIKFLFLYI